MRYAQLGDLGELKNGVNFRSDQMGRGVPLINVKDITGSHRIDVDSLDLVDIKVKDEMFTREDDLFFVRSSVKLDGIALSAKLMPSDKKAIHCGFVIRFRPISDELCTDYLLYLLRSWKYRETLKGLSGGTAIVNISQGVLKGLRIPLPSLPQQKRIASILSAYDNLIENNRRRIQLLEQAARLLYKEWFVHLRFPGHEHVTITNGVPEGWRNKSLTDLADSVSYGFTASSAQEEVGPKFLRITDIVPAILDWEDVPFCEATEKEIDRNRLEVGDVVVARTGATVGYAKLISHLISEAVYASYLVRFRFRTITTSLIAGIFMESDNYKEYVRNHAGGAAQPNANAKVLGSAILLIPPQVLLEQFNVSVIPFLNQRDVLIRQNTRLVQARDLLLPRLMNGEVAV